MRNRTTLLRDLIPAVLPCVVCLTMAVFLLASPADAHTPPYHVGYVESANRNIRVHYETASASAMATQVLGFAETVWDVQIDQMGFYAPMARDASDNVFEGMWIYLVDSDHGMAAPTGDVPGTSWTDCTVDIIIPNSITQSMVETYVHHEVNHAVEMAMDCTEASFAYEQTTSAVTAILFPEDFLWTQYFLPTFQAMPHAGLDCTFFMSQDDYYYHYGAALFSVFLDEHYGGSENEGGAPGELLARIWEAARQDGTVTVGAGAPVSTTPNDPDLLEAMATVLGEQGVTLEEAFITFARWRYFVGDNDDGKHFANADLWTGSEVTVARSHTLAELPLVAGTVSNEPAEYGTSFVELELTGLEAPDGVVLDFQGSDLVRWHIDALAVSPSGTAEVQSLTVGSDGLGTLPLAGIATAERLVLVISALGDETHDADNPHCSMTYGFTYDLRVEDLETTPMVDTMTPGELDSGTTVLFTVQGSGFMPGLTAELQGPSAGEMVGIVTTTVVDDTTLTLEVTALPGTAAASYDLLLTNPNGLGATLTDALQIITPPEPVDPSSGCGCNATSGSDAGGGASIILVLLIWLLIDWRRPRKPCRGRPR